MVAYSIDQLECFVTAAKTGSFSEAGRQLGKAQSAVSTSVANLEIDFGVQLFDRSGKYLELTGEAAILLREAETILYRCARLHNRALAFAADVETRVRVAVDEALRSPLLQILPEFAGKFPATELEMNEGLFTDVHTSVARGQADIGLLIGTGIPEPTVKYKLLAYIPFQAAVSIEHPLSTKGKVAVSDLEDERQIIITSRGEQRHSEITPFSHHLWLAESYASGVGMLQRKLGWAFLPEPLLREVVEDSNISPLSLELEHRVHTSPLYLLWKRDDAVGQAGQWLFEMFETLGTRLGHESTAD